MPPASIRDVISFVAIVAPSEIVSVPPWATSMPATEKVEIIMAPDACSSPSERVFVPSPGFIVRLPLTTMAASLSEFDEIVMLCPFKTRVRFVFISTALSHISFPSASPSSVTLTEKSFKRVISEPSGASVSTFSKEEYMPFSSFTATSSDIYSPFLSSMLSNTETSANVHPDINPVRFSE